MPDNSICPLELTIVLQTPSSPLRRFRLLPIPYPCQLSCRSQLDLSYANQATFCLLGSVPPPPPPIAWGGPFVETSVKGDRVPVSPPVGAGRFTVNGRYWPLFPIGLPTPPGAPICLAWFNAGLPTPPALGRPGPNPTALEKLLAAGPLVGPRCGSASLLGGGTCFPSLLNGLEELWSIPGVFRIEGLSRWGSKALAPCTGMMAASGVAFSGNFLIDRAE